MPPDDVLTALTREAERLVRRLGGATTAWYAARPDRRTSRAEMLRRLVADLAALGVRAGTGQPADAAPRVLGNHALGDQITLLTREIVTAPAGPTVAAAATAAIRAVRDRL
ncbi:MAG TPA: hypothetical protein VF288_11120 [Mycobacteriales bacterium]